VDGVGCFLFFFWGVTGFGGYWIGPWLVGCWEINLVWAGAGGFKIWIEIGWFAGMLSRAWLREYILGFPPGLWTINVSST